MSRFIENPTTIKAAGNKPKIILEYVGRVNSQTDSASLAHMKSPSGWVEPGQRPEFTEYTLVLKGELRVKAEDGTVQTVRSGQAVIAEYVAVCLPAFSPDTVHRDDG